jgi:hypothetical protein
MLRVNFLLFKIKSKKNKAIPVIGLGGLWNYIKNFSSACGLCNPWRTFASFTIARHWSR